MELGEYEIETGDPSGFEKSAQLFARRTLTLLKHKGFSPIESLQAVLGNIYTRNDFGELSWLVAEHLMFIELIRRHKISRFFDFEDFEESDDFTAHRPAKEN